jgi:RNA polymerase sigma factor (sigma-70 family)
MSPVEAAMFVEALYKAHAKGVLAKLRRLGIEGPALEDVLQDVFVVAWRRYAKIPKDSAGARRWLLDSARKHAANFHRLHRHKYEELNPDAIEAAVAEPADPEAHAERGNLVRRALRELAGEDAELLWRHEVVGESLTEFAVWLDLTKSGAHVRLGQAKKRFRVQVARLNTSSSCKATRSQGTRMQLHLKSNNFREARVRCSCISTGPRSSASSSTSPASARSSSGARRGSGRR